MLYQNTCDSGQVLTSLTCQNQATPALTIQNLTFSDGDPTGQLEGDGGGGAVFVRGGRLKVINSRFFRNVCDRTVRIPVDSGTGQDVEGGAVRVLNHGSQPVHIVNSTFGGERELGNSCQNGGALSGVEVSWNVLNGAFSFNRATKGGAIRTEGTLYTETLCGVEMTGNTASEGHRGSCKSELLYL